MRALFQRVAFTADASTALVDEQGLNSLGELRMLTDDDCNNICKIIKRPGGTIQNANGDNVANPGHSVSLVAEKNLKLAVFYLKHKERCSEPVIFADVTLASVRNLKSLYDLEQAYKAPDDPDPSAIINPRDWTKTFDALEEHLESVLGVNGVPLNYIVRPDTEPKAEPADGWTSEREKMIARAPHFTLDAHGNATANHTNEYQSDNLEVWNILSKLTRNSGDCWTYVKVGQPRKDGRAAFRALYEHYLGAHNVENQANYHENRLRTNQYHGEKRRHNFHKYATETLDSIQSLNNLKPFGYSGVDARSAVRYLIDGVKDTSLDSTKNAILASDTLRSDFTACVNLFKDFIAQRKTTDKQSLNVSDVASQNKDKNKDKGKNDKKNGRANKGRTGVEFRYYKQSEYKNLSNDQKEELKQWRENRDNGPPKKKQRHDNLVRDMTSAIVAAMSTSSVHDREEGEEVDADAETEVTNNRTNSALTRQGGRRR